MNKTLLLKLIFDRFGRPLIDTDLAEDGSLKATEPYVFAVAGQCQVTAEALEADPIGALKRMLTQVNELFEEKMDTDLEWLSNLQAEIDGKITSAHVRTESHNYLTKLAKLAGEQGLTPDVWEANFVFAHIAHEEWCDFSNGFGFCNCDPEITFIKREGAAA